MNLVDIHVGQVANAKFLISEESVKIFSELTFDFAPIHHNAEFAKQKGFAGPIAHGLLTSSFVSGVLGNKLPGPNSVINEINLKYHKPVYIGQTIKVEVKVLRIIEAVKAVYLSIKMIEQEASFEVVTGKAICSF